MYNLSLIKCQEKNLLINVLMEKNKKKSLKMGSESEGYANA
jgi:hypothetical protein